MLERWSAALLAVGLAAAILIGDYLSHQNPEDHAYARAMSACINDQAGIEQIDLSDPNQRDEGEAIAGRCLHQIPRP